MPLVLAFLISLVGASSLLAQARTPSVVVFPASVAAAALGDAYPLATGAADVLFYAPGAINGAAGVSTAFSASAKPGSLFSAAGAMGWLGGTVAVGLQNGTYGSSAAGADGLARHEAELGAGGPYTTSETALSVGYGRDVGPVDLGLTGRLMSVRSGGRHDRGGAVDVGASLDAGFGVAAFSVRALGAQLELDEAVDLPTTISLGFATRRRPLGPLDILAAAAVDRLRGGDFRPGGGIEVSYWPVQGRTFAARVGYDHAVDPDPASGLTLGGAFMGDDIRVDYAWARVDSGQSVHRLGVSWR